jgi:hypothetical protein
MNKISLLRRYGLPVIACGFAVIVARPLRVAGSDNQWTATVSQLGLSVLDGVGVEI